MKTLSRIASVLLVAALLWVAASHIEVCVKNMSGIDGNKPHYSDYNLYTILMEVTK